MSGYALIIDGGTTNTRVTLLDAGHETLDVEKKAVGVGQTAVDGHNGQLKAALKNAVDAVLARRGIEPSQVEQCVACGMITSNVGLCEIPHVIAPAGPRELHAAMQRRAFPEIAPFPMDFIPGVRNFAGPVTVSNFSQMDMMRGEETEAMGLWRLLDLVEPCVFILPGSHNKFVSMDEHGRILKCLTSLSGEMLAALTHHTILADAVHRAFATEEGYDAALLLAGYREAERSGLGRAAFAGRILSNLGGLGPEKTACYLLGAVLQSDVTAIRTFCKKDVPIYIAGKQPLQKALFDVLCESGYGCVRVIPGAVFAKMGVWGALTIASCGRE